MGSLVPPRLMSLPMLFLIILCVKCQIAHDGLFINAQKQSKTLLLSSLNSPPLYFCNFKPGSKFGLKNPLLFSLNKYWAERL